MAELIPPLNSCISRMQSGERRFARRLTTHLEDDYLCWYETGVGLRPTYTDFVILHPMRGLLLLEVKDWRLDSIRSANPDAVDLITNSGLKRVANPLKQARLCMYKLKDQLERDPQLVDQSGDYRGRLIMPYGYGVVFTNISRSQLEKAGLDAVFPEVQTICQDEMLESIDPETLQKRMWDMLSYDFHKLLTQPQIDRVRWHMFPEVRVSQGEFFPKQDDINAIEVPDIIKVMDLQQEKLARGLGEGHRVIHGVAGSGKTMILGYRCLHIAKLLHRPILVLCYNVALAARLKSMLQGHGVDDRVSVYSIHSWANAILKTYNFRSPAVVDRNYDAAIEMVIEKVGQGHIPRGQYGAILIDEGHDFQREWLRLVVDMVDPDTNSVLLLYDDTQSIYKRTSSLGFSLKDVGIEAQGRTTILKLNYRNTEEILKFAFDFIDDYVKPTEEGDDRLPIVAPNACGRKGPVPEVWSFPTFEAEARHVAAVFARVHKEREMPWSDMGVLYCYKWMGKALADAMTAANVSFTWLQDSASKHRLDMAHDSVKLITMHSSKGLEFRTVATCGIGSLGLDTERVEEDAKLLYVAMTRATETLLITSSKASPFASKLQEMAAKHRGAH